MSVAVSINHVSKIYKNGFQALKDIDFQVNQGEFFALLGPNGAGKTTLISAMAGLVKLTSGSIQVQGFDIQNQPFDVRRHLGVVPQEIAFDPFFSVREALRFQSGYFGIAKNDDWIEEILQHLGLLDKIDTNTRHLSGGMKRRLMVAQALVHKPDVIVLDEPTAGVDVDLRQNLWAFMRRLNEQGHTIILTTHYLEEAQNLCTRIAMMKQGQLLALDSTENLLKNNDGIRIMMTFRQPENIENLLQNIQYSQKNEHTYLCHFADYEAFTQLMQNLNQHQVSVENIQTLETDLESVFLKLMQVNE
ncbi:MAG: ABC transporter ATP-binding protein [Neisseriaceae bacterium]|nr:ABC transporter ATP-binding protein [Neisseriaceae bacterium]